jgi:diguanylate cyclase (GGDEF)-like protein/PAS domain S-box-containing protein
VIAIAAGLGVRRDPVKRAAEVPEASGLAALAGLATASFEVVERELRARIAALETHVLRYQTAIDNISTGVCFFDGEERLILSNRRYAEMYHLAHEQIQPGATLREIVELRAAAGTGAMVADDYLSSYVPSNSGEEARIWTAELADGRTIQIRHQPMPGGGWVATHEDITELKAAVTSAKELLSLQALIDRLPDNLWVKDVKSRFVIANQVTAARMGFAGPADLIGKTDLELLAPEIANKFYADEQRIVRSGQPIIDMEECVFGASGDKTWISTTKVPLRNDRNEIFGVAGVSRDVTERRLADLLREGQAQILQMIAMSAPLEDVLDRLMRLVESQLNGIIGSVLLLDETGSRLRHGAAPSLPEAYTKAIDGVRIGPKVGSCGTAAHRREAVFVADIMTDPLWADYKDLAAAHGLRSCWSTPILSHQDVVLGTFAMYSKDVREPTDTEMRLIDVATRIAGIAIERKLAEDRIHFMATHDSLTGLPNRALLNDRLSQALLQAQRYDHWVTVLFVDLDNFKLVNDSLGHNAGDELLKTVARRMVGCVRATDTVVRLGGDEFVILLLDQPKSADMISVTAQKIRAAIAEPVRLESHDLSVASSMGIANYPSDGADADTLLANADAAMYRAKEIGRDNFQFYTPELNARVHAKFLLQEELRNAVARSQFVLLYQPQVDLRTGRLFAVEALVRWKHPNLGMILPMKFIPMAEETGVIVTLGDWVLHEACRQNKAWQNAGLPPINVCVNLSARQLKERNLVNRVVGALKDSGLEAKYLELELTESLIMEDVELAVSTMRELQDLGVHLSIDDFGTGYSSLSALKTFPVARLKIDKSFIDGLLADENDKAVAGAVISLGQKLGLRVIAEGVETEAQAAFLRNNNCDEMQGYLFSRPVPAQRIAELLSATSG